MVRLQIGIIQYQIERQYMEGLLNEYFRIQD